MNLFFTALKEGWKFPSSQGNLDTGSLFKLPLTAKDPSKASLESVARNIASSLREEADFSFVDDSKNSSKVKLLTNQLELIKEVIKDRKEDAAKEAQKAQNASTKEKIDRILDAKEENALSSKTKEELLEIRSRL